MNIQSKSTTIHPPQTSHPPTFSDRTILRNFSSPEWKFNYLWLCLKPHKLSIAACGPVRYTTIFTAHQPLKIVTDDSGVSSGRHGNRNNRAAPLRAVCLKLYLSHSFANYEEGRAGVSGRWTFMPADRPDWIIYGESGRWADSLSVRGRAEV